MIYQSTIMHELLHRARRYAQTSATVLIHGESGTGKELLARIIHEASPRSREQYVCVNCAAFSDQLVESDLFGHEMGAFTGATRRRPGCFELAGRGSVFLDEIGELPLPQQAKLLRVIEDAEIRRVGGIDSVPIHARVIAATNRHLDQESVQGKFRADLYHRLSVLNLEIPPLRLRREDIPLLVDHFVERFRSDGSSLVQQVAADVMEQIVACEWPGNVRQLRNAIQRACVESMGPTLDRIHLPPDSPAEPGRAPGLPDNLSLREIERLVILSRIEKFKGNRTEAAAQLGVTTRTLRNKVKQYEMLNR